MLHFLEKTYRGRLREWWLETSILFLLCFSMCFLTCSIFLSYSDYQVLLKAGEQHLAQLAVLDKLDKLDKTDKSKSDNQFNTVIHSQAINVYINQDIKINKIVIQSAFYAYTQLFVDFQNKHPIAVGLRLYEPKRAYTTHLQSLSKSLVQHFALPLLRQVTKELEQHPEHKTALDIYWALMDKTRFGSAGDVQKILSEAWLSNLDKNKEQVRQQVETLVAFYIDQVDSRLLIDQVKVETAQLSLNS